MRITILAILLAIIFVASFRWARAKAPFKFSSPLACYAIDDDAPNIPVALSTQFGSEGVTVLKPEFMCTPVTKELPAGRKPNPIKAGDHLQCYKAEMQPADTPVNKPYLLTDQFAANKQVTVGALKYLCEPTDKTPATDGTKKPGD